MTYIIQNVKLSIEASKDEAFAIAKHRLLKFFPKNAIGNMAIYKTSIDARKKDNLMYIYSVEVKLPGMNEASLVKKLNNKDIMLTNEEKYIFLYCSF